MDARTSMLDVLPRTSEEIKLEIKDDLIQPPEQLPLIRENKYSSDTRKMILLIESNLSQKTTRKLNQHTSTYIVTSEENEKWIDTLPECDIYIVDIRTCLNFYLMNLQKLDNYLKIYYCKIGKINDKNIPILKLDFIRRHILKSDALSKEDLFDKLSSETYEGLVQGCFCIFCNCLCSRITCCDCMSYTFKSCYSFF